MSRIFRAMAPATSANLGSGFDVFGVALDSHQDTVEVEVTNTGRVRLNVVGAPVPVAADKNTAGLVAKELLAMSGREVGLDIRITKGVEAGKGLGSSAASAAAAAVAVNEALGLALSPAELVPIAARGEVASAGAAHADNVAPSLLGGFTIIGSYEPLEVVPLTCPNRVSFILFVPEVPKKDTASMRSILPKRVGMNELVFNVGRAATFAAGVVSGDTDLMGKGMEDAVVEEARSRLYPGVAQARARIREAGAKGVALSGAGPSLIALLGQETDAPAIAKAGIESFRRAGVKCGHFLAHPGPGAHLLRGKRN